jgi:hypothetical protein
LGWFERPVLVRGKGHTLGVGHVVKAGEYLRSGIPQGTPKRAEAIRAVMKAMESAMAAKERTEARKAFVDAAREAGVLLGE